MRHRELVTLGKLILIVGLVVTLIEVVQGVMHGRPLGERWVLSLLALVVGTLAIRKIPELAWMIAVIILGYLAGEIGGVLLLVGALLALIGNHL
jgi:hypothetical protein